MTREAKGGGDEGNLAPRREHQEGALGVMFFAAAGGLALLLGVVAIVGYLLMR